MTGLSRAEGIAIAEKLNLTTVATNVVLSNLPA